MQKTPNIPEAGKIYQSSTQPGFSLYVQNVTTLSEEENDGFPATFFVEACAPDNAGDAQAIGYELSEEEWNEQGFSPT